MRLLARSLHGSLYPFSCSKILARNRFLSSTVLKDSYENVQVEQIEGGVGLIRLHRPKALNALSDGLFDDLLHAATALNSEENIGCLILTGSAKAFAAGADISEMKDRTFAYAYQKVQSVGCFLYRD
jgi:enoyl-CoA hydratase/carnithine racemase